MMSQHALSFPSSNESNVINVFLKKMYDSYSTMSKIAYVKSIRKPSHPQPLLQGHTQSLNGIKNFHWVTANSYYMAKRHTFFNGYIFLTGSEKKSTSSIQHPGQNVCKGEAKRPNLGLMLGGKDSSCSKISPYNPTNWFHWVNNILQIFHRKRI